MTLRYYMNKKKIENMEENEALLKDKKHYTLIKNIHLGLGITLLLGTLGLLGTSVAIAYNELAKQADIISQTRYEEFNQQWKEQRLEELDVKYDNKEISLDEYYAQSKRVMNEDYDVHDYITNYEPEFLEAYNSSTSNAPTICAISAIPTAIAGGIFEAKSRHYEQFLKTLE